MKLSTFQTRNCDSSVPGRPGSNIIQLSAFGVCRRGGGGGGGAIERQINVVFFSGGRQLRDKQFFCEGP